MREGEREGEPPLLRLPATAAARPAVAAPNAPPNAAAAAAALARSPPRTRQTNKQADLHEFKCVGVNPRGPGAAAAQVARKAAREAHARAAAIRRIALGDDHPLTVRSRAGANVNMMTRLN